MTKLPILPKRWDVLDANDESCRFRINIDVLNEACRSSYYVKI